MSRLSSGKPERMYLRGPEDLSVLGTHFCSMTVEFPCQRALVV